MKLLILQPALISDLRALQAGVLHRNTRAADRWRDLIHTHTLAYQPRERLVCFADHNSPFWASNWLMSLWGKVLYFIVRLGSGLGCFGVWLVWGFFGGGIFLNLKFKAIFRLRQTLDFCNYRQASPSQPGSTRQLKLWFRYLVPAALPVLSKWFHVTRCITISERRRSVAANPLSPLISLGARSLKTDALVTNREKISTGGSWIGFNHLLITSNETYSGEEKKNR